MASYDQLPHGSSLDISRFSVKVPEIDLNDLRTLLRLSKLGPKTYENMRSDGKYGVSYEWMSNAKAYWQNSFNWHSVEDRINSLPNFIVQVVDDDGETYPIHFLGLFSNKPNATPLMCIHGWPGSFLEFIDVLLTLRGKYTPDELPYHVVVPSLPGYAFSATPPLDRNWKLEDSARLLHKLMVGLGFEAGYVLQGGDIGSYTARIMASFYDSCKALHLNFCVIPCPNRGVHGDLPIEDFEKEGLQRGNDFAQFGTAYAVEHATRTATIGFTLSSSPLALLAWIGEKFLAWTDETPSLDQILESVTLYWLTETFARAIYPYRQELVESSSKEWTDEDYFSVFQQGPERYMTHNDHNYYCRKPMGYSWFPKEIAPVPKSWAATTGNLRWFRRHDKGGHFAAMEQPHALLQDIEDFISEIPFENR
ncbi:Alpha/Beta hydrolase protein [Talaromyces proteolyticus]|uniref:Alpha/Beta hydrolase protein n=1 Tax=Talaromyces proteolyticus TaxID=1131652 RepID=A0AAD4PUN0_9EURO|nr:Alpha/Beta hydrolase protein [Talaromyces proteolyticus]KAH8695276.1 Alpha/Beta hydrolase protein [Talaromyces proteolyticus]